MQQQAAQSTELFGNLLTLTWVFSIMTESIITTPHVTLTSQALSEDFFSDSSLIFVPSKEKKSTRQTSRKNQENAKSFEESKACNNTQMDMDHIKCQAGEAAEEA